MISKNKLLLDVTNLADSDNVGAYLRDASGNLLTSTDVSGKRSLDVNVTALTATDIDIRDLTHVSDSIKIGDGTDFLAINADGSINANVDVSVSNGFEKAEDAAHADGDIGAYMLSVRQNVPASSTSADGDYQSLKTDALGRMWVNNAPQSASFAAISVTSSATDLVATDLVNRKKIVIQNVSNREVFVGSANTVTASNGLKLPPGSSAEFEAGPSINFHAITASGTADVRIMEFA